MIPPEPSKKTSAVLLAASIAIGVSIVAASAYFSYVRTKRDAPSEAAAVTGPLRNELVDVGGVKRPSTDVVNPRADSGKPLPKEKFLVGIPDPIEIEGNPAAESIQEAVQRGDSPERFSPVFAPKPFNLKGYQQGPTAYLNIHEPGRARQTADPGPGVPVLKPLTDFDHALKQRESVRLSVETLAGMPVTFTSFDLGTFENGLTSISVAADDAGRADATFTASSGTIGRVNVLAGSPVAAENVHFKIRVLPPSHIRKTK